MTFFLHISQCKHIHCVIIALVRKLSGGIVCCHVLFVLCYFEEEHRVPNTFWQELMQLIGPVAISLPELPDERLHALALL